MEREPTATPGGAYDALYGLEVLEISDELVRARVEVRDRVRQPFGIVHGGVYASLAETLASLGTDRAAPPGRVAVGVSTHTSFLRPVSEGHVHASARVRHRGRTSALWDVDIRDDHDRACALARVTLALRSAPAP